MIQVDIPRGNKDTPQYKNQASLCTLIRAKGVPCEAVPLASGDAAFEGKGPDGTMTIGVERKSLHDMLNCIDTHKFAGKQRITMNEAYTVSFLMMEGYWKPREDGLLMESRDGCSWFLCRPNGKTITYSKLRRYLISISYSGVIVIFTRNLDHTAADICELYHYHQKKWDDHTSLREIHKVAIPQMNGAPSLVRQWASCIDGIGVKKEEAAEKLFRKPIKLATAEEIDWLKIDGISPKKAQEIVRKIHGYN